MSFDFKKMLQENIRESRDVQEEISIKDSFQKTSVDLVLLGKQGRYMPHLANENISIELKESLLLEICTELFETQEYKDINSNIIKENRKLREEGNDYYHQIVKEYIHQTRGIPLEEIKLNEGVWDFIKKITKKVGDAIEAEKTDLFGGISKEDQAKFDAIIDQATDERIKNLVQIVKKEAPKFPNDKDKFQFQSVLAAFEVAYESLYKAAEAWCENPDTEGGTDPKTAEELITKLRFLLKFYLDKKLKDKYRYKLEEEEERGVITERERILEELGIIIELLAIEKQLTEATVFGGVADTGGGRGRQPRGTRSGGSGEFASAEKVLGDKKLTQMWYQVDIAMRAGPRPTGLPPEEFKKFIDNMRSGGRTPEEATAMLLKSIKGAGKAPGASGAETGETGETPEGTDVKQAKQAVKYRKWKLTDKPGVITGEFDPEGGSVVVMKSLKSHKLPLFLLGMAGMLGAYGWLVQTPLVQNWLKSFFESGVAKAPKQVWESFKESAPMKTIAELGSSDGATGYWQALGLGNFGPDQPALDTLKKAALQVGDNVEGGLSNMATVFENPEAKQAFLDRIAQFEATDPNVTMAEFFPSGPEDTGLWLVHPGSSMVKTITTTMLKATGKGVAKTALKGTVGAAIIASLGSWAIPLGLAIIPAAAGVALLRWKGRKMSRAQQINDVLKRMKPPEDCIEDDGPGRPPPVKECPEGQVWDEEKGECVCPEGQVWDEEKGECVPKPGPTPGGKGKRRVGLLRFDDDATKIYRQKPRAGKSTVDKGIELGRQAQDQTISGDNTNPTTDTLNDPVRKGGASFAIAPRSGPNPEDIANMDQVTKIIKGKSKRDTEAFVTIDASIYKDAAEVLKKHGLRRNRKPSKKLEKAVKKSAAVLFKKFLAGKKGSVEETAKELKEPFKALLGKEIPDEAMVDLIKVFQTYGLTDRGKYKGDAAEPGKRDEIEKGDSFEYTSGSGRKSAIQVVDPENKHGSTISKRIDPETCKPKPNSDFALKADKFKKSAENPDEPPVGKPIEKCSLPPGKNVKAPKAGPGSKKSKKLKKENRKNLGKELLRRLNKKSSKPITESQLREYLKKKLLKRKK